MNLSVTKTYSIEASQVQILNPGFLLPLIPFFNKVVYPLWGRFVTVTPLYHKMGTGLFLTSLSFVISAGLEILIDQNPLNSVSVFLIIPQFFVLTCGEILVSITGLEFSYKEAPSSMKALIMSVWLLTVAIGNAVVAIVAILIPMPSNTINFLVYAALLALFLVIFLILNRNYKYKEEEVEEKEKIIESESESSVLEFS